MLSKRRYQITRLISCVCLFSIQNVTPNEPKTQQIFTTYYHTNYWGDNNSKSGGGSNLVQTRTIREELPYLFSRLQVKTILDAACGDFFWMKEVDLDATNYIGADIVEEMTIKNEILHGNEKRTFIQANIVTDQLPKTDLIFCRDCLVHLKFSDIFTTLKNFKKSGATYILITTFPSRNHNGDLTQTGQWRTLNFQLPPFNFPQPIFLINEGCTEGYGHYKDKSLGLWRLEDLTLE